MSDSDFPVRPEVMTRRPAGNADGGDSNALSAPDSIDVVLEGGPTDLPMEIRTCQVGSSERKVKVTHYGGYEHFERVEDASVTAADSSTIFRWTGRTRIAE